MITEEEYYRMQERLAIVSESLEGAENRIRTLEQNKRDLLQAFRKECEAHDALVKLISRMELPYE